MIKKNCLVLCLMLIQFLNAQDVKFGKVTKEELLETSYSRDESANALILYKNQQTYFQYNTTGAKLVTEIHERIKIYNKEGFEYATQYIDLYKSSSSEEEIGRIKAFTFNLENNEIVKTELDKNQIFKDQIRYNYNQIKFTMPNIKEGSVIEFKYKITSPFIWNIDEFRFQYDIPIKHIVAQISTPEGFNFKSTPKGYVPFSSRPGKSYDGGNATKYVLTHVPALKSESYVDNIDNYRAGVMFELVSINIPGVLYRDYARSWKDVAQTIGSSDDYKNKLDKTKSFNDELEALLADKVSQTEKMKTIFSYVKENITCLLYTSDAADD